MNNVLLYFTLKYKGDWEKIYNALEKKEKIDVDELMDVRKKSKYNYISIVDDDYPNNLKMIYKPPFSIFWQGNYELFNYKLISIFGKLSKEELLEIYNSNKNICFIINFDAINKDQINILLNNNIRFIGICSSGINLSSDKEILKRALENNLLISEFHGKSETLFSDQPWTRISIGLSQKAIFKYSKNDFDANVALQIGNAEKIKMYYYGNCDKKIITKFNLVKYNSSELFTIKN